MLRRRPRSAEPAPKRRSGPWVGAPGSCPGNPWTIVATKVTGAGGTAGATGAMAIKALTFARLGPRRREGRAAPRRNHKADAKGAASGRGAEHRGTRHALWGSMRQAMPPEFSPAAVPPGHIIIAPVCGHHKGSKTTPPRLAVAKPRGNLAGGAANSPRRYGHLIHLPDVASEGKNDDTEPAVPGLDYRLSHHGMR